jgi:tetratricopeptide (TPR) repeat protein
MAQSDMTDALRHGEELLALARSAGDANWIVLSLVAVHAYASGLGDFDRARAAAREGEKLARELELTDIAVLFINNRASEEAKRGNLAAARKSFGEALALNADSDGSRTGRALILLGLGEIAVEEGKLTEATTLFGEVVGQVHEVRRFGSIDLVLAGAVEGFAAVAAGRGDAATAARLLGAAHARRQLDNTRLQEWEQRIHDNTVAAIQAQLSADDFTRTFMSGRNLTLDEAIDYAHATGLVQAERD